MYKHVFDRCPDARTCTYINGDLISTHDDFVATVAHLFPDRYAKLGEFLMVDRRTNVPWSEEYGAFIEDFDFKKHFDSGKMMQWMISHSPRVQSIEKIYQSLGSDILHTIIIGSWSISIWGQS